jgi:hypothetical protein
MELAGIADSKKPHEHWVCGVCVPQTVLKPENKNHIQIKGNKDKKRTYT